MIAIIDYGIGNLFSVVSSFKYIGADAIVTSDPEKIKECDRILLPGVGAFEDAAKKLRETGLDKVIIKEAKAGKPILGICLGMQMLFEKSYEYGEHNGLGLLKGRVIGMQGVIDEKLQIPHIGYNDLIFKKNHPLLKYINEGDFVYFVHSYYAVDCDDSLVAYAEYDKDITAIVAKDNVMGCQFHPEKSGEVGLNILRAFCEMETVK
ncbi:MAG: imidazole glycerol phosphate synthase subunit HisH [Clostridia bacterium]|nr:imidazole glycerol phosphate synthase subunit HisH [Clostridia bacterium]